MQVLSKQVSEAIAGSSWIRRMFEAGIELKKKFGADNVFDFSLGNPDLPSPAGTGDALREIAAHAAEPLAFGYMPNAGLPELRAAMAAHLGREQACALMADHVIVTCGAAGALNVFFRAVLEPGDEVVCPAPYFVEYGFYVGNGGGRLVPVPSRAGDFSLDAAAIEKALTPRTRAVIVNSPNNPTGRIYTRQELEALAAVLCRHTERVGRPVYLLSDEPYRFLAYDGAEVAPLLPLYPYAAVIGSFSKNLSLAGERIGYIALAPDMPGSDELMKGLILCNRTLGFVNAPVIGQRLVLSLLGAGVDVSVYDRRRRAMARVLEQAGIPFFMPQGAFYFFPEVPGHGDDKAFVAALQAENILGVPGSGFGFPGHFRLVFCVDERIVERAAPGFKRAVAAFAARR